MSFVSIRCPNCAATESIPVGENQYQCRYCDNTFHYANPDAPKITKNITVQESNHCPICGRGVTAGTSNRCMKCRSSDFCGNCIYETLEKKLVCKNCLIASSDDCLTCGNSSLFKCFSCIKLHEKDPSHVIVRYCIKHGADFFVNRSGGWISVFSCNTCGGLVCHSCVDLGPKKGWLLARGRECKNCGNRTSYGDTKFSLIIESLRESGV